MCRRCFKFWGPMESDHVWPKSRRGPDSRWNRQKLCRRCNRRKGATYADYRLRNLAAMLFMGSMLVLGMDAQASECSWDTVEQMGFEDGRAVEAVSSPYEHCLQDPQWADAYQRGFTYGLFDTTKGAPSYQWRQAYGYLTGLDGTWDDDYPLVVEPDAG